MFIDRLADIMQSQADPRLSDQLQQAKGRGPKQMPAYQAIGHTK